MHSPFTNIRITIIVQDYLISEKRKKIKAING